MQTIAVHIHLFYQDLIPEFVRNLGNIPVPFDLYISAPEDIEVDESFVEESFLSVEDIQKIVVSRTPNRGRDIAPILCTYKEEIMQHDLLLHLHTKNSPHIGNPDGWRIFMLEHILGSKEQVDGILKRLSMDASFVCPPDFYPYTPMGGWNVRKNMEQAQELIDRSSLSIDLKKEYPEIYYPQGTFFWCRTDCLKYMFEIGLMYEDFPNEPICVDGTIAHALERLFFVWNTKKNLHPVKIFFDDHEKALLSHTGEILKEKYFMQQKNYKHLKQVRMLASLSAVLLIGLLLAMLA